ncbi:hypothetical protein ACEPPN_000354 [Leptodophora sp. 'Broadleaf-Isolate-01']
MPPPRRLGPDYESPQHPRPYPFCSDPDTRIWKHEEGGSVSFYDGVPVFHRKIDSPRLGLHDNMTPISVYELKEYLQVEIQQAAGDSARGSAAWQMLEDIRLDCWSWFSKSRSWGQGTFHAQHKQGVTEEEFMSDLENGLATLGEMYPSFAA